MIEEKIRAKEALLVPFARLKLSTHPLLDKVASNVAGREAGRIKLDLRLEQRLIFLLLYSRKNKLGAGLATGSRSRKALSQRRVMDILPAESS